MYGRAGSLLGERAELGSSAGEKKKIFTTKDTKGHEEKPFKRTFSTQARRSTAMVQHEEPIRTR
jgi:hypothetical protein